MSRLSHHLRHAALPALIALSSTASAAVPALASSTFDSDTEGWTFLNDARYFAWSPTDGNPDGHIHGTDIGNDQTWYYVAPDAFLGNKLAALNGTLSYDMLQDRATGQYDAADVILIGNGVALVWEFDYNPAETWTHFSVTLNPSAGWRVGDPLGDHATDDDFHTVLSDLSALYIRGEYRNLTGFDNSGLDNVVLLAGVVPEPSPVALLLGGMALIGVAARRLR